MTLRVTLVIVNHSPTDSPALTYFTFLNPDGNASSGSSLLNDIPGVSFAAGGIVGESHAYGIDEFDNLDAMTPGNIDHEIFQLGSLSNTNYCGAFCDMVAALEWDIGVLLPGERAFISVAYSDVGEVDSLHYLTATRADDLGVADDSGTVLTISGRSRSVPVPSLSPLGLSALAVALFLAARGRMSSTSNSRRPLHSLAP